MGMHVGGGSKGGGRRGRRGGGAHAPMSEINMTPFIDVVLVLLIIFMVAAPMLTTGVPLDLPKTSAGALNIDQKPLMVSVNEKGLVYLQDAEVKLADLPMKLQGLAKQGFDERIYVRGAETVSYGKVAEVIAALRTAGYTKTALINQPQEKK